MQTESQVVDLIGSIPSPDTVRDELAETIRRKELLKSLLRVALRKAAYPPVEKAQPQPTEGVSR